MEKFVDILLPVPVDTPFTYGLPEAFANIRIGSRALVPFQTRLIAGVVMNVHSQKPDFETKSIREILDVVPLLNLEQLEMIRFFSDYYHMPQGLVLQVVLPPGMIRQTRRRIFATPMVGEPAEETMAALLKRIRHGGELDFVHLMKKEPRSFPILQGLVKEGWVVIESVLKKERAKERVEQTYEIAAGAEIPARLSPLQKELLSLLATKKTLTKTYLTKEHSKLVRVAKDLVKKSLLTESQSFKKLTPEGNDCWAAETVTLNLAQQEAVNTVVHGISQSKTQSYLLHGITGSGKTEVYLNLAKVCLGQGKTVLALVPEISLTPQFMGRFRTRFGEQVAILHSALSDSERLTEWKKILEGKAKVVVGARSAVFAPLENIGIIIIDEEHDSSYKQHEGLLYDARFVAQWRAQRHQCSLVLGSATPSLETFQKAEEGAIVKLELNRRARDQNLPTVEVADLRKEFSKFGEKGFITELMRTRIEETLSDKKQVLLFLNRRGHSPVILCPSCGETLRCQACSVGLTYHKVFRAYLCHYCAFVLPAHSACPKCHNPKLIHLGIGTENIERELIQLFPDAVVDRMDRDNTQRKGSHEKILGKFLRQETDILIGTQMITKGLDVETVGLVGVILADQGLHMPDFRACERTFQLITQVVGRTGRGKTPGRALLQTFLPDHYAIETACQQDYQKFSQLELETRRQLGYPPFSHIRLFEITGQNEAQVRNLAQWLAKQLRQHATSVKSKLEILGPSPAPLYRLKDKFRFHVIVKAENAPASAAFCGWVHEQTRAKLTDQSVSVLLDIDPQQFL